MNIQNNQPKPGGRHTGSQRVPDQYPTTDKLPKGMHEAGDAYWDQKNHDDFYDGLRCDGYDPRD